MLPTTCKNGHPLNERVFEGGRWRCLPCKDIHYKAQKQREKEYRAAHGRSRPIKPVCPSGCITVCTCEEL